MSVDLIRYDLLVQDALRAVVRRVLTDVARDGLPGEHHLYISFDTCAPGVRLSPRLKEKYPEEMTIVLQHQFWDLVITEPFFEVGLSFNGIPERLHVPFDALKGFFDPSVKFGLQFEPSPVGADAEEDDAVPAPAPGPRPVEVVPAAAPSRPTSVPSTRPAAKVETALAQPAKSSKTKDDAREVSSKPATKADGAKPDGAKLDGAKLDGAKPAAQKPAAKPRDAGPGAAETGDEPAGGGAQVVRLDAFRKK